MGMGTGAAPGCRGMERYREMLEGEDARPFPMGQAKPYGEGWCLPMGKLKLCISIYREALKLEDRIGPQEFRLLGRYARAAGDPQKVARMTEYLASEAFEKEHGHADFSFRLGMEEELLLPEAQGAGRESFLHYAAGLARGAQGEYGFKDWELRLLLGHACHSGGRGELAGLVGEAAASGGIPEGTARRLAGEAERREMEAAGFGRMEGMAAYICPRQDLGFGKDEMKGASFLLHNGALLYRCRDGTKFFRTGPFTVEGSYTIPHFYVPVHGCGLRVIHFEVADEKRERDLFERYCADGNMPEGLVSEMRQGRSILKELKECEKMMGIPGPGGKGRERQGEGR